MDASCQYFKKIRWGIYENIDEFLQIIHMLLFKNLFPTLDEDTMLKKIPKDFSSHFKYANFLKYKSYTYSYALADDELQMPELLNNVVSKFKILAPFNKFLNRIVEG